MKKYYVNLPIVFGWGFIVIIGIMGFIWETLDLRTFNVFSLIMSVIIPIVLEIIIILIFAQYCKFDDHSIKKFLFNKIIKELKGKITIILTTHYMEEAENLSDRVGIMANSNLVDIGTVDELIKKTKAKSFEDAFVRIATGGKL